MMASEFIVTMNNYTDNSTMRSKSFNINEQLQHKSRNAARSLEYMESSVKNINYISNNLEKAMKEIENEHTPNGKS